MTPADVPTLPARSRATAVSVWLPLATAVVFQVTEYGAFVSSVPRFAPSTVNCTPATPPLSAAHADTVMEPETVAPGAGEVSVTVGGVVSSFCGALTTPTSDGAQGGAPDKVTPTASAPMKDAVKNAHAAAVTCE